MLPEAGLCRAKHAGRDRASAGGRVEALRGLHILSCDSPAKWRAQQKAALKKRERKS